MSMRSSRQGYWSGLPFPSPGDLPRPGGELGFPVLQADSTRARIHAATREAACIVYGCFQMAELSICSTDHMFCKA